MQNGQVFPMEVRQTLKSDGSKSDVWEVHSETADKWYRVYTAFASWKCTCPDYSKRELPCKHINVLIAYFKEREGAVEPEENLPESIIPPPAAILPWIITIHGKNFIKYQGLLALAHEKGMTELGAYFITVKFDLAVAYAWVKFMDGSSFWECGEATPDNVAPQVKKHFPRVALTRAKARVLRDALNIGMVSEEELE